MKLIDAHAHLSFFNSSQLDSLFLNAKNKQVTAWVMAGFNSQDWHRQKDIFQNHKNVRMCFGLHPWQVLKMDKSLIDDEIQILEGILGEAHACGETGIDGFKANDLEQIRKQEEVFIRHLEINKQYQKPLVLHIVKEHERCLNILKKYSYKGIVHGFSGSWEMAQKYISLGYKISLGRGIYHKGFKNLKSVAQKISLDDFVIESDAYITDEGEVEDPLSLLYQVAQSYSQIKQKSIEEIAFQNHKNIKDIFGDL